MTNFWYHPESDCYLISNKMPDQMCVETTPEQYFTAEHPNLYVYDIETFPNVFTVSIIRPSDLALWRFEISERRHDGVAFFEFLTAVKNSWGKMVGYNNLGFDYPVIHDLILQRGHIAVEHLYNKAMSIITSDDRFSHLVWDSEQYVPQIDLFKIHHFDNVAKSTSLKMLEFNMRLDNISDLPFEPGTYLTPDQIQTLVNYNDDDVLATNRFLHESIGLIEFRNELTTKYNRDFTNHNDTKIGKDYFVMELEKSGIECFRKVNGRKQPVQTVRPQIALNDVILHWLNFEQPEFQRVLNWLRSQVITETKGVFSDLSATINGFQYDFGTGGIHGSVESQIVYSDTDHVIIDLDVASYYPNLAIANRFYPEHLSERFCDIYLDVYNQRKQFAKGTPENAMLKLALNGVYGDSNNKFSPFYDPAYTMSITINGQLLLCLLSEWLLGVPGLTMIQINTDGLTVRVPRSQADSVMFIAECWEQQTGLELERADYNRMMIRDVNNYIAEYENGDLKRKGAYCYGSDLGWHQNHSSQVVAMAAQAALVDNVPVEQTIRNHPDIMDFMLRTKVPRNSRLMLESPTGSGASRQLQNITRYYVSNEGGALIKVMPPTPAQVAKNPQAPERRISIDASWTVRECNNLQSVLVPPDGGSPLYDLNYEYYIKQAEKLVKPLRG